MLLNLVWKVNIPNLSTPTDHLIKSNRLTSTQFMGPFIYKGPAVPLLWQPIYHSLFDVLVVFVGMFDVLFAIFSHGIVMC